MCACHLTMIGQEDDNRILGQAILVKSLQNAAQLEIGQVLAIVIELVKSKRPGQGCWISLKG